MKADFWRQKSESIVIPIVAILLSMVLFGLFCLFLSKANPFGVFGSIYQGSFSTWSTWQRTLIGAAPIMLCALCTALPARMGYVIIGNEGALIVGGLGAIAVGLTLNNLPPLLVQIAMAIGGITWGGLWIMAVGALRHYRAVNETISSLLMNYIAIALMNELVEGVMRDPSSLNKPSTYSLATVNMLGALPGTRVHYGLLYGLIACGLAYFLIERTTFGFSVRATGGNIRAAKITGLPVGKLALAVTFLAGSCAGLAGMVEVAAVHGNVNATLNSGYGYSGVLVAFIARYNPLASALISILLGGILASGGLLQRLHNLPDAAVLVFQGLVFLCVLWSECWYGQWSFFSPKESA